MSTADCAAIREHLPELLTGRTERARDDVEAHLCVCADCRREVDEIRATLDALREAAAPSTEAEVAAAVPPLEGILAAVRAADAAAPPETPRAAIASPARPTGAVGRVALAAALLIAAVGGALLDRSLLRDATDPVEGGAAVDAGSASAGANEDSRQARAQRALGGRSGGLGSSLAVLEALSRP